MGPGSRGRRGRGGTSSAGEYQDSNNTLRAMFESLDTNHDGRLSARELRPLAKRFGMRGPQLLKRMDRNGDGGIDLAEFIRYMK